MLAGMWPEFVPAETALGQVAAEALTIWACAADGTLLPVAGLLAEFAGADPALLTQHPVVTGCQGATANMPVQFFVRFNVWDVDATSPGDAKGGPATLQPDHVDLIDASTRNPIPGSTWTWKNPYGVLTISLQAVKTKTFWLEAGFPTGVQVRLERGTQRLFPATSGRWSWPTAGWTAADGTTPGT
jgi:hypothetical protein